MILFVIVTFIICFKLVKKSANENIIFLNNNSTNSSVQNNINNQSINNYCSRCGSSVNITDNFCNNCGAKFIKNNNQN